MVLDPRARRKAKDFPASPQPGYKASGYNEALDNLAPQLAAADALDASFGWLDGYLSTGTVALPALMSTTHCCRGYRRAVNAHVNEVTRDAPTLREAPELWIRVRDKRRVRA